MRQKEHENDMEKWHTLAISVDIYGDWSTLFQVSSAVGVRKGKLRVTALMNDDRERLEGMVSKTPKSQ